MTRHQADGQSIWTYAGGIAVGAYLQPRFGLTYMLIVAAIVAIIGLWYGWRRHP